MLGTRPVKVEQNFSAGQGRYRAAGHFSGMGTYWVSIDLTQLASEQESAPSDSGHTPRSHAD